MKGPGAWALSLAGAALFHAGMASALLVSVAPEERRPTQSRPESRLDLAVVAVPEAKAQEVPGEGEAAPLAAPDAAAVASGVVAAARARPVALAPEALSALANPPAHPAETPAAARVPAAPPVVEATVPVPPSFEAATGVQPAPGPAVAPTAPEPRSATALVPDVVTVPGQSSGGEKLLLASIPAGTAPPVIAPTPDSAPVLAPAGDRAVPAKPTAPESRSAAALVPDAVTVPGQSSGGEKLLLASIPAGTAPPVIAPTPESAPVLAPAGDRAFPATPPQSEVLARTAPGLSLRERAPEAVVAPSATIETPSLSPAVLPAAAAPDTVRPADILPPRAPEAPAAPEVLPSAEAVTAALAFSAELAMMLREGAVDAVEAFLVPDPGADGQALRDGIAERLGGVACARVQTAFDPETGALELRGHVPTPADRTRLAAAIEAELRGALPVVDRLLELPPPQCEVLSALAAAGIPQSTEQFTNPLIIGEDSHARVYSFRGGDTMRLDLGGADYDGWLYLDYYDSAGDVLHLTPNEAVPPTLLAARAAAQFGGGGAADIAAGRVRLQVGPPFGKDIAVALVASAPLFDDLRPTQEPAPAYLAALAQRVEELRRGEPGFKIEWVYLFVSTEP